MNRSEFMKELEYLLQDIPEEDREDALSYYRDYLEEAGDEGEQRVIQEFGSPERIAAIIRSDLSGHLEDGGEFTDSGYQDERFRDPRYQVLDLRGMASNTEHDASDTEYTKTYSTDMNDTKTRFAKQKPGHPGHSGRSLVVKLLKAGAILLAIGLLSPILFGAGGILVSIVLGVLALVATIILGIGMLTIMTCVGAGAFLISGLGFLPTDFMTGITVLGAGIVTLGFALIGIAVSLLVYGCFLPFCIRGVVDFVSRLLHRGRRRYA